MLLSIYLLDFVKCRWNSIKSIIFLSKCHGISPKLREILEIAGIQCMLENVQKFLRKCDRFSKKWMEKRVGRLVAWKLPPKLQVAPHRVVLLEMNIPGFEPSSAGYVAGDVAESGRQAERSC